MIDYDQNNIDAEMDIESAAMWAELDALELQEVAA